ncbi:hypothetical protein CYY_000410 [Polysphondylium violaceum]|uniref:E2 ubiquitin-conjugating enzyme n=1 Tax=Polysphondylium violaceum TaxID=133409 RepID=A0A8J4PZW8_9MYCE|nr:hypothetical protein CYY_000410 [Polysphondylium violaceum]
MTNNSKFSQTLLNRVKYEVNLFEKDPPPGIQAWIVDGRLDTFEASIIGLEETPYERGVFKLNIKLPEKYPMEPPQITFKTPIYHPNIDSDGRICLDILNMPPKGEWKVSLNLSTVLNSIRLLMSNPNQYDPLMADINEIFKNNYPQFQKTAQLWTKKYATGSNSNALEKESENEKPANSLLGKRYIDRKEDDSDESDRKQFKQQQTTFENNDDTTTTTNNTNINNNNNNQDSDKDQDDQDNNQDEDDDAQDSWGE